MAGRTLGNFLLSRGLRAYNECIGAAAICEWSSSVFSSASRGFHKAVNGVSPQSWVGASSLEQEFQNRIGSRIFSSTSWSTESGKQLRQDFPARSSFAVVSHPFYTASMGSQVAFSSESTQAEAAAEEQSPPKERTKLLVIGGNGFVGSHICAEAVSQGLSVLSLNRSGPPRTKEPWVDSVEWVKGDVFNTDAWKAHLEEVTSVVSCVGAFGSNEQMLRVNGEANAKAAAAAAEGGVRRFVFISAHDVGLPSFVLRGYYQGKKMAEEAVRSHFPYGGVVLRPAMIHGTRQVGPVGLPLSIIGAPLELVLKNMKWAGQLPLIGPALAPPLKVTTVAKAAVRAASDNAVPPGVLDVWAIDRLGS